MGNFGLSLLIGGIKGNGEGPVMGWKEGFWRMETSSTVIGYGGRRYETT